MVCGWSAAYAGDYITHATNRGVTLTPPGAAAPGSGCEPVLVKMGRTISDPAMDQDDFLRSQAARFKITDITIPVGEQVLRIHASQKLLPVDGDPRHYRLELYAPHLSLVPTSNVELGVTVLFPLGFAGQISEPTVAALPGQAMPNTVAGGSTPVTVANHQVSGWHFRSDPVITFDYRY